MSEWLTHHQLLVRVIFFILLLIIMATWEIHRQWRWETTPRWLRWIRHASLTTFSLFCIKLIFPIMLIGGALAIEAKQIGILPHLSLPLVLKIMIGLLAMDFAMYWQHRMMHQYSIFWRIHRVHHMDRMLDISTGLRFHPLEAIIMIAMKIAAIGFFGIPVIAVILYEMAWYFALLFTHLNVRLLPKLDRALRRVIVTPGMHRIHHSDTPKETNSNYGFCLSVWDKLFKSYTNQTKTGEVNMVMGLEEYRAPKYQMLENMLLIPFNVRSLRLHHKNPPPLLFEVKGERLFKS